MMSKNEFVPLVIPITGLTRIFFAGAGGERQAYILSQYAKNLYGDRYNKEVYHTIQVCDKYVSPKRSEKAQCGYA